MKNVVPTLQSLSYSNYQIAIAKASTGAVEIQLVETKPVYGDLVQQEVVARQRFDWHSTSSGAREKEERSANEFAQAIVDMLERVDRSVR